MFEEVYGYRVTSSGAIEWYGTLTGHHIIYINL